MSVPSYDTGQGGHAPGNGACRVHQTIMGKRMSDLKYLAPRTLDEAVSAFAAAGGAARILAGGTDLLVQMRAGVANPGTVINVKKIAEMTTITELPDGGFRIGAAVSGAVIGEHAKLKAAWPGVVEAINLIGSKQVQGLSLIHI